MKVWGRLWALRTKIKAHYLWLQTTGTWEGQLDNWQVSLQVNWGWMFSKEGALCTAWHRQYWAQYRHKKIHPPIKNCLKMLEKICPVQLSVTGTVWISRNHWQLRRSCIYVAWLYFLTYMFHCCHPLSSAFMYWVHEVVWGLESNSASRATTAMDIVSTRIYSPLVCETLGSADFILVLM